VVVRRDGAAWGFDPNGIPLTPADCGFVAIGADGLWYRDGVQSAEVVDPADCSVVQRLEIEDLPTCEPDYTSAAKTWTTTTWTWTTYGTGGSYPAEPTVRAAAFDDAGATYLAYHFDECGPWYYLHVSNVDRYDVSGWAHVWRRPESDSTDVAVTGSSVYLVRPDGVASADADGSVGGTYTNYGEPAPPLVAAGEGPLSVPIRAEVGPDDALYVLDDLGQVIRYPVPAATPAIALTASSGRTDLAFLPDGRLVVRTADEIDAFDAASGAPLGVFATGPSGPHLAPGPCP
jgi:hypothetical protein